MPGCQSHLLQRYHLACGNLGSFRFSPGLTSSINGRVLITHFLKLSASEIRIKIRILSRIGLTTSAVVADEVIHHSLYLGNDLRCSSGGGTVLIHSNVFIIDTYLETQRTEKNRFRAQVKAGYSLEIQQSHKNRMERCWHQVPQ